MGRRAKNKQSAPEPLEPKVWPTPKKLGKRKADVDTDDKPSARPLKKIKEANGKGVLKQTASQKDKEKKSKQVIVGEDEDSADGWEDVEDEVDLKAQAKCVCIVLL